MADIYSVGIEGSIVTPSSAGYEEAIARNSATSVLRPAFIVFPSTPSDISRAIQFAVSQTPRLEIAIKGGGCNPSTNSSSEGGLVIDLSHLNAVTVSEDRQTVSIQGGARWGDVYSELEKHNLVVVGGNVWFVGVGGFTTGGGHSHLSGQFGLAIDNLIAATVVLADGQIVRCNKEDDPDLFWAIKGGGNQFGVVVECVTRAHPARGPALAGALAYPGTELPNVLRVLREHLSNQRLGSKLILTFARTPPDFYPGLLILPYVEGEPAESEKIIAPFRSVVKPVFEHIVQAPNFNAVSHGSDAFLENSPPRSLIGGVAFGELWDDIIGHVFNEWISFTENEDRKGCLVMWEFGHRDKVASVPRTEAAFALREPHYYCAITGRHNQPDSDQPTRDWISEIVSYVANENTKRTGEKFVIPLNWSLGPEHTTVQDIFGDNLPRLRKVKAKYDPKKVWSKGWVIEPDFN